jgi:hypothetical protein
MGQVTIYLEDELEEKMSAIRIKKQMGGKLDQGKVTTEWPESIPRLSGDWKELSLAKEGRANPGIFQ